MGVIQFHVQRPDLLAKAGSCSMVDFLMYDGRIAPADVLLQGDRMICRRTVSESGQFRLSWPRFSGGSQVVHSTSLREQSEPYELELELARGQLSRLRNQFSIWHGSGLQSSSRLDELIRESHRSFRAAALRAEVPETSAAAAVLSMELSAQAADMLCEHYVSQRIEFRRQRSPRIPVLMGCHLNEVPQQESEFLQTFNAVQVSLRVIQPWGEYLSEVPGSLSPIQFFDTLRRCGVRIGEVNLDLRLSQSRLRCLRRDPLSLSQLIDHWSLFQIPLNVMITVPPLLDNSGVIHREDWLRSALLMCLSKERVTGIWLSDWQGGTEGASLMGADGQPDSSLKLLQKLTRELLW